MEDTLIAAYTALITGYCIMEDEVGSYGSCHLSSNDDNLVHYALKFSYVHSSMHSQFPVGCDMGCCFPMVDMFRE